MNQSYRLICSIQSGQYLGVNEHNNNSHQQLKTYDDCGDNCIWKQDNKAMKFVSVANINVTFHMKHPNEWNVISASPKLPSQYVKELQTIGHAIIENILDEKQLVNIRNYVKTERKNLGVGDYDDRFIMPNSIHESPEIASASAHPIAMNVIKSYLGVKHIHQGHIPWLTVLRPVKKLKGTFPEGGWHVDYPYRLGRFSDDEWPEYPALGVQYNICVDDFKASTGGTQFIPGSHLRKHGPGWKEYGEDVNIGGTKIGEGVHRDVVHVEAPAGSAFIYDSRLWHRLAPETNISGKDRAAILCAVTPAWVIPMLERSAFDKAFENSLSKSVLSKRDIRVVEKMVGNGTSFQIQNMNLAKDRKARRQESKL